MLNYEKVREKGEGLCYYLFLRYYCSSILSLAICVIISSKVYVHLSTYIYQFNSCGFFVVGVTLHESLQVQYSDIICGHSALALVVIPHFRPRVKVYRIAGNFRGVKYSLFSWAG